LDKFIWIRQHSLRWFEPQRIKNLFRAASSRRMHYDKMQRFLALQAFDFLSSARASRQPKAVAMGLEEKINVAAKLTCNCRDLIEFYMFRPQQYTKNECCSSISASATQSCHGWDVFDQPDIRAEMGLSDKYAEPFQRPKDQIVLVGGDTPRQILFIKTLTGTLWQLDTEKQSSIISMANLQLVSE